MLNLQEVLAKTEDSRKQVKDALNGPAIFHPSDTSIYTGLKPADAHAVRETMKTASLSRLIQEYLGKSGTTGIAGAAYLIPDKIYDIMFTAAYQRDLAPQASNVVTCPGSSLKVDVEVDGQFVAHYFGGGGSQPQETIQTTQVSIAPKLFGINACISNELIEDSQFDVIELHLRRAAEQMGEFSTHQFLAALIGATDGDGTQNTISTGAGTTTDLGDLLDAAMENLADGFHSDVAIIGPGPLSDILQDDSAAKYSDSFHSKYATTGPPLFAGEPNAFMGTFVGMKVYVDAAKRTTGDGALYLSSKWHSLVLNKANAMLTVRKRWLKLEDYSDPVRDLVGASITARQFSKSIYNDASCEITES